MERTVAGLLPCNRTKRAKTVKFNILPEPSERLFDGVQSSVATKGETM